MSDAVKIVEEYLRLHMIPDPDAARRFCAPEMEIRFTGNLLTHVVEGASEAETIVYQTGTLYGEWPDGTPFEGNRYVDRYFVRHGKIVKMEVWNDSAEWLL